MPLLCSGLAFTSGPLGYHDGADRLAFVAGAAKRLEQHQQL